VDEAVGLERFQDSISQMVMTMMSNTLSTRGISFAPSFTPRGNQRPPEDSEEEEATAWMKFATAPSGVGWMKIRSNVPQPGELYFAYADKRRPVVVVSWKTLSRGDYVVSVPLTSACLEARRALPNCAARRTARARQRLLAQADAISLLHKDDLDLPGGAIGRLNDSDTRALIRAIGYVSNAECEPL